MPNYRAQPHNPTVTWKLVMVGVIVTSVVTLVTYFPGLRVGFFADDWKYQESIGRLGPWEFTVRSFDPTEPSFLNTYRPLQGLLLALEYPFFGKNPVGYRSVHILLHLANCLAVELVVWGLVRNYALTLVVGLLYATFPIYSMSVFLPSDTAVLATLFYLLAIWFWLIYLRATKRWAAGLTYCLFVLGLLSKEFVLTLPIVLFLIDRFFVNSGNSLTTLFRRYGLMAAILLIYIGFQFDIQPRTYNYYSYGAMTFGPHLISNLVGYGTKLILPWTIDLIYAGLGLAGCLLLFLVATVRKYKTFLVFISVWAVINVLPYIGYQTRFSLRYLYLAGIASALFFAALISANLTAYQRPFAPMIMASVTVVWLLIGALGVAQVAQEQWDEARDQETLFRTIARRHPVLASNTRLYLIDVPAFLPELSGTFYVRYGDKISVGGNGDKPQFHNYADALLYYFDSTGKPTQVHVQEKVTTRALPPLPVTFDSSIRLEGYELTSNSVQRGQEIVLFLYWRPLVRLEENYTVFVHLVDGTNRIAGEDSQPMRGRAPTTAWRLGELIVDAIILPIPTEVEPKLNYHLEVGLYRASTLERLPIVDEQGTLISHQIKIEPFAIR